MAHCPPTFSMPVSTSFLPLPVVNAGEVKSRNTTSVYLTLLPKEEAPAMATVVDH